MTKVAKRKWQRKCTIKRASRSRSRKNHWKGGGGGSVRPASEILYPLYEHNPPYYIPFPIYDLTKNSKSYLWLDHYIKVLGPVSRKASKTFRARKAIFSSSVSKNGEVYAPETFWMKGTYVHIKNIWVKQVCNSKVPEFAMALRARRVSGGFRETGPCSDQCWITVSIICERLLLFFFQEFFLIMMKRWFIPA